MFIKGDDFNSLDGSMKVNGNKSGLAFCSHCIGDESCMTDNLFSRKNLIENKVLLGDRGLGQLLYLGQLLLIQAQGDFFYRGRLSESGFRRFLRRKQNLSPSLWGQ